MTISYKRALGSARHPCGTLRYLIKFLALASDRAILYGNVAFSVPVLSAEK